MLFNRTVFKGLLHGQVIECVWTTVPGLILVQIALPSLSLLYLIEDSPSPNLTLKAVGHQWYWEYEYTDFWSEKGGFSFDSYILPESDLEIGIFRQLETDNRIVAPIRSKVRVLITRADVLHSWTIPSSSKDERANWFQCTRPSWRYCIHDGLQRRTQKYCWNIA